MATEKRLIDANTLKERAIRVSTVKEHCYFKAVGTKEIDKAPTVDAVEVVHGRWEDIYDGKYANPRFRCSVCKEKSLFKNKRDVLGNWIQVQALTPFCPHCGAALDGGKDNG